VDEVLQAYERLLARAFGSREPVEVLRAALADPRTPSELRDSLSNVDEDGVRISALIVTRLRFERLVQGSRRAAEWFERDARGFAAAFKRYQDAVPPRAGFPAAEAEDFERWLGSGT
jgi:hypothetical protein